MIRDYDPGAVINSFSDYIEWVLDFTYSFMNKPKLFWASLLLMDDNNKLVMDIVNENGIPLNYIYVAIGKRLLNDLEKNFDEYHEEIFDLKFEKSD